MSRRALKLCRTLTVWLWAGLVAGSASAQVLNLPDPTILPLEAPGAEPGMELVAPYRSQHPISGGPQPDFDPYFSDQQPPTWPLPEDVAPLDGYGRDWSWQFLPEGLVYRSYLAGPKESRISSTWFDEKNQGWLWDVTLGGRVGILRHGSKNSFRPEGWQVDVEGSTMLRLDPEEYRDLVSADFRFGVPITYAIGAFEAKLAYYHLSSHLGDEFLLKNPTFPRINYSRDAIVLGLATFWTDDLRLYGETGYAVAHAGGAEPWEFQFGFEYSPVRPTSHWGAPFLAANAYLREEVNYSGTFTAQAGWQWRGHGSRHLFRAGVQYLNGKSPQLQFFDRNEQQLGVALWHDY